VPPPAWEQIAVTGKARAAIRRATREAVRKQFGGLGRQILSRVFERAERPLSDSLLQQAAPRLGHQNVADLVAAVGRGEVTSEGVLKAVYPDYQDERTTTTPRAAVGEGWFGLDRTPTMKFRVPGDGETSTQLAIPIRGISGELPVQFAPESGAVPGDRIVGILTPGEGITVYPIQSPALKEFDDQPERWLDVRWDINPDDPVRFPARIALTSLNEPGSLAQIAQVIADSDGNIDNIKMVRKGADFHEIMIDLEVWDLKHLNRITSQLKQKPIISSVERALA
jgi:guanosine-3',5'-bis(diphosphate) 3'-pyrophosphohydrolase